MTKLRKYGVFLALFALGTLPGAVGVFGPTLFASPAEIPNHKSTVVTARIFYAALSGPQRAFCIGNKVAYDLRGEGAGTFFKDSGQGYLQRSLDVLIYKPKGETFDILGNAENTADPQWGRTKPSGFGDVAKWRPAVDPATLSVCGSVTPPDPPVDPPVPPSDLTALTARVTALEAKSSAQGVSIDLLKGEVATLTGRVVALEQKPPAPGGCTPQVVSTTVSAFHSHKVQTCLP